MQPRRALWPLLVAIVVASCDAGASVPRLPSPPSSADATLSATVEAPASVAPSDLPSTPPPTDQPAATTQACQNEVLSPGSWMVTLVDGLRVRSQPRVSNDSTMYEPLLPKGTNFSISSGPVFGSGYCWYDVELAAEVLDGGITRGWVAEGNRDGTPWIKNIPID
jgi:hypothetical protein